MWIDDVVHTNTMLSKNTLSEDLLVCTDKNLLTNNV